MKKGFLLLIMGIMSAPALADTQYVFRKDLTGVKANETFGMNESQKEAYFQEIEDRKMCLNEFKTQQEVEKTKTVYETRYRTAYRNELQWVDKPYKYSASINGYSQSGTHYWSTDGRNGPTRIKYGSYSCTISGSMADKRSSSWSCGSKTFTRGSRVESDYPYTHYKVSLRVKENVEVPYQESYQVPVTTTYTDIEVVKTENYDYCELNGYPTKN